MKWIALLVLAISLILFWPKTDDHRSSDSKPEPARAYRSSIQRDPPKRQSSSRNFRKAKTSSLQDRIFHQWPEIDASLPASDPRLVKFILILRELGKRDGPGTLALLDQLDRENQIAEWLQARMAVAGGWALSDPEAAAQALLEKDHVLPADFQSSTNGFPIPINTSDPAQIALTRAAKQILSLWVKTSPDLAREEAYNQLKQRPTWNSDILREFVEVAISDEMTQGTGVVERNSIDAILNNPNRSPSSWDSITSLPLTDEMKNLGEPATSTSEWAARNPEHALNMINELGRTEEYVSPFLISGLARGNDDYEELVSLAHTSVKMNIARQLIDMSLPHLDENVWLLDGRQTTWTLTVEERAQAARRLLDSTIFSAEERATLNTRYHVVRTPGFSRIIGSYSIPELPNKVKDPTE